MGQPQGLRRALLVSKRITDMRATIKQQQQQQHTASVYSARVCIPANPFISALSLLQTNSRPYWSPRAQYKSQR